MVKATYLDHMGTDESVVNAARLLNKVRQRVVEAHARGYFVTDSGICYGPKGVLKIQLNGTQRYPTISTNWNKKVFSIPAHYLAAYCFYKDAWLLSKLCVRHLNGNTLDLSKRNIKLGTHSENNLDKKAEIRGAAAKAARKAQGSTPKNAKLTKEAVLKIRAFYAGVKGKKAPNGSVTKLAKELGVCREVLHKVKTNQYYGDTQ